MEIECPGCAARYDAPDDAVRPGRAMRCARCGETWVPVLPGTEPAPAPAEEEAVDESWIEEAGSEPPATLSDGAEPAPRVPLAPSHVQGGGALLVVSWVASGVVLLAACWLVWHFRAWVVHAWPPATRLLGHVAKRG